MKKNNKAVGENLRSFGKKAIRFNRESKKMIEILSDEIMLKIGKLISEKRDDLCLVCDRDSTFFMCHSKKGTKIVIRDYYKNCYVQISDEDINIEVSDFLGGLSSLRKLLLKKDDKGNYLY